MPHIYLLECIQGNAVGGKQSLEILGFSQYFFPINLFDLAEMRGSLWGIGAILPSPV